MVIGGKFIENYLSSHFLLFTYIFLYIYIIFVIIFVYFFLFLYITLKLDERRLRKNEKAQFKIKREDALQQMLNKPINNFSEYYLTSFIKYLDEVISTYNLTEELKKKYVKAKLLLNKRIRERELREEEFRLLQIESPNKISTQNTQYTNQIDVDTEKGFFSYYHLNKAEREYLLKLGYKLITKKSINSKRKEKYLLRPRFNEGIPHFFLVYDIKRFFEKNKIKVEIFQTKKPDLVFEINGNKYAIEVETGKALKYHKRLLLQKIDELNKNYEKNWLFVVTNKRLAPQYSKLGKTTDIRYIKNALNKKIKTNKKAT